MMRFLAYVITAATLWAGPPNPRAKELSAGDLAFFVACARSSAYDMLGKNYAPGDDIRLKYVFNRVGVDRAGGRFLYIVVLSTKENIGRLFQLVHDGQMWIVRNDADIRTKPRWALASDPLGGVYSTSLMERALRILEKQTSESVFPIGPLGSQPQGCRTYAQGVGERH
jgi:hypothetical protein